MSRAERQILRFVRAMLPNGEAHRSGNVFLTGSVQLEADAVRDLIGEGVLAGDSTSCRPGPETRQWLRRQLSTSDEAFASQHRIESVDSEGRRHNLAESPLARLASTGPGETRPFLEPHHVEAGERVRRFAERAQLRPRVTMSYSAAHTAGGKGARHAAELTDMAMEARRTLGELQQVLPRDCAGVVLDVCAGLKGLQEIEAERGWPRRSAKLVLRIGLDRLAEHFGLSPVARGEANHRKHRWMEGERPPLFE